MRRDRWPVIDSKASPSCAFGSALRIARRTASRLARDSFGFDATYSRTDPTRFLDSLAVMLGTLCAHPKPIVWFRNGAGELADPRLAYLLSVGRMERCSAAPPCAIN